MSEQAQYKMTTTGADMFELETSPPLHDPIGKHFAIVGTISQLGAVQ